MSPPLPPPLLPALPPSPSPSRRPGLHGLLSQTYARLAAGLTSPTTVLRAATIFFNEKAFWEHWLLATRFSSPFSFLVGSGAAAGVEPEPCGQRNPGAASMRVGCSCALATRSRPPCRQRIKQLAAMARKHAEENGNGEGSAAADAAAVAHLGQPDTSPPSGWRRQFRCAAAANNESTAVTGPKRAAAASSFHFEGHEHVPATALSLRRPSPQLCPLVPRLTSAWLQLPLTLHRRCSGGAPRIAHGTSS